MGTYRSGGRERNSAGQFSDVERPTKVQQALRQSLPDTRPEHIPPDLWEVLVLHVRDGLSYREIAGRWGSSPNKPQYRAKKAVALLVNGGSAQRGLPEPYARGQKVYGEIGVLDDDGQSVVCHVCGKAYAGLAYHVWQTHGMSADDYRKEFGLMQKTSLICTELAEEHRKHTSHLRAYDAEHAQRMREWDTELRRQWGCGREIRPEQRLDPGYQQKLEESVARMHDGLARARAEGRFTEPGWPDSATRASQRALAIKRKDPAYREEMGRRISEARGGVSMETRYCEVCGEAFEYTAWMVRLTCSEVCSKELRRRRMVEHPPARSPQARKKISEKAARRSPQRKRDDQGRYS